MPVTYTNKEAIANRALLLLGGNGLVSFDDETTESNLVSQIYNSYIQFLLSTGSWRFAMKKQELTRLDETPVNEWTYSYTLPSDFLKLRSLFNSSQVGSITIVDYELFQNRRVYADTTQLYADYISYPDESYWPAYFVEFAINALAYQLAYPLTRDQSVQEYYKNQAFGSAAENWQGGLYAIAAQADSASNPSEPLRLTYLSNARHAFYGTH